MRKWILIFSFFGLVLGSFAFAQSKVEVNFFYRTDCPFCAAEEEFLSELKQQYPQIEVKEYEVIKNTEYQKLLKDFYEKYQVPKREQGWLPVTFTPTKYFVGFSEEIGKEIKGCLEECLGGGGRVSQTVKIPFWGTIDVSKMSLPVLTVTLGALDGFNPCAMWTLLFLIALLVNIRSRLRMWLVGGIFILASGIFYYLILTAWLNLFLAISFVSLTRILIGALAIGVGIWQLKNFIRFRPGVCKVTDGKTGIMEKIKDGIENHTEKIALSPLTIGVLVGVIILALGVNLVEFFCSAGLPAIFTRILTMSELSSLSYYLYLLLYTFIFILDDLIVFLLAVITLSKIGFTERYNYWATLFGGLLILILGVLLIFKPEFLMFG